MEKVENESNIKFLGINKRNFKEYVKTLDDCYKAFLYLDGEISSLEALLYDPRVRLEQKQVIENEIENYRSTVEAISIYQYELDSGLYYRVNLKEPIKIKNAIEIKKSVENTNMSVLEYEDMELPVYAIFTDGVLREICTDTILSDVDLPYTAYIEYTSKEKVTNKEAAKYFDKLMNTKKFYEYGKLLDSKIIYPYDRVGIIY